VSGAIDRAADELYGLPLDEFVPRRELLVRKLRADGQRDDADMVKRMPKPTAPAWVVNQLARQRSGDVQGLLEAGEQLRRVQEWLLRREAEPGDLRAAVETERAAVGRLVHAGADVLVAAGRPPRGDVLERIAETLHAAAADPALRAELERGRVVRDQAAVGLGPATGPSAAPAGATRRSARARPAARALETETGTETGVEAGTETGSGSRRSAARKEATKAARGALRSAEAEAKAAERMQAAADRAVERAMRALEAAETNWQRARAGLQEARDELAAAEKAASAAREAADAAEDQVAERRRRVDADDED